MNSQVNKTTPPPGPEFAAESGPSESAVLELARRLIARKSVTPEDMGCQDMVRERLAAVGFTAQDLPSEGVQNIWLGHGEGEPALLFLGHTDVVPPGSGWSHTEPFDPLVRDGYLYGRGAADMKGSVAAMVVAMECFTKLRPQHQGQLALALTSDEEGVAEHGTKHIVEWLREQNEVPDYCLVGEPTASNIPGDSARCGRRGSLSVHVKAIGKQGHVAYADKCINPVHLILPALNELASTQFDNGNEHFPPTGLQIVHIASGNKDVMNVVPGQCDLAFNLRYSPKSDADGLKQQITGILRKHAPDCEIDFLHSASPFYSEFGALHAAVRDAAQQVTQQDCLFDAAGGTSDGRFIAPLGVPVVELGPCNATIHQVDECVKVEHLQQLAKMYLHIMLRLLPPVD